MMTHEVVAGCTGSLPPGPPHDGMLLARTTLGSIPLVSEPWTFSISTTR